MKSFGAAFLEIFKRDKGKFDKSLGVYRNGVDNNYPDLVETLIEESVTASQCWELMSDYIVGKGFGDAFNELIVNASKGISGLKFCQEFAQSRAMFKGVFIHVNYNGEFRIKDFDVLPYGDCRVGKKDDNKYHGKILVCSDWSDSKQAKKAEAIDVFNPDPKVIAAQIEKAGGINQYKGQILFVKEGHKVYPLSRIHPAIKDADSEQQTGVYKNASLRKGFFGKTVVVTPPMVDGELKGVDDKEYNRQLSERDHFRKTIQQFIGAENVDGVMHIEQEFHGDSIEKEILFKNIDSNINDKLFAHTEKSVSDNIRTCFKNVPAPLVRSQEGGLFGDNITQAKLFYQDQTHGERMILEETVNLLMSRFHEPMLDLNIIPLIDVDRQSGNSEA